MSFNNGAQIVRSYRDTFGNVHGFLLSGGNYTRLDVPRSFGNPQYAPFNIAAKGINDSAQVVGSFQVP